MKRKLLSVLVLLLTAVSGAWADGTWPKEGENGSEKKPYTISSAADWNEFCASFSTKDYVGEYVTLTCNIPTADEVNAGTKVTQMAAETYQGNYFKGTFDGGNYTITVDLGSSWEKYTCGLFRYLDGATIKNLKVDGTVCAYGWKWRGGFAGATYGNCTFENCTSKVTINAGTYMNNHSSGGFVGCAQGNVTFTNCVFQGQLSGAYATHWGGFVGQKDNDDNTVTLNKCLFAPQNVNVSATSSATFVRTSDADGVSIGLDGAYCTQFLGTQQGTLASTTEPTTGEGIYKSATVNNQACYVVATVSGIEDEYIADGGSHTLTPVLTCMGTTLTENTDYTIATGSDLTYSNTGDYSVTFNAAGSYTGSCTVSYKVVNPSGSCGTGVTWTLTSYGVLTISGSGAMTDYSSLSAIPWSSYISDITRVVIKEGVTTIGNGAFYSCNNLESVSIPVTVTSIGEEAFAESGSSTGMTVTIATGSALESIGAKAFLFSNLKSITLPDGLTTIGINAFNYCSSLASVYVMATTPPALGNYAFDNNASGRKIYVPDNSVGNSSTDGTYKHNWSAYESDIEALPKTASGDCGANGNNCTYTLYENGLLVISGTGAMADYTDAYYQPWVDNRSKIKTIVIEDGVTSIGNYAFSNCENATSVSIPASVTSIGYYSFGYCYGLSSLTIADNSSLETIGSNAFYSCSSLPSVTFPASVTSIGDFAFDCSLLTTATLNSIPSIGTYAFPTTTAVTMNLTANSAAGANWTTFYNENYSFVADANTQVFKVALSGTGDLTMNKVDNRIVDAGTAVVLKNTVDNPVMTLTTTASGDKQANSLIGVSAVAGVTATDASTIYVLYHTVANGVGFYKLATGSTVGLGKAYLTYNPGPSGGDAREYFLFDEATGISATQMNNEEVNGEMYDLQGRRVAQPAKGMYIVNGKKYIKK